MAHAPVQFSGMSLERSLDMKGFTGLDAPLHSTSTPRIPLTHTTEQIHCNGTECTNGSTPVKYDALSWTSSRFFLDCTKNGQRVLLARFTRTWHAFEMSKNKDSGKIEAAPHRSPPASSPSHQGSSLRLSSSSLEMVDTATTWSGVLAATFYSLHLT